jgi:hypothetical protein
MVNRRSSKPKRAERPAKTPGRRAAQPRQKQKRIHRVFRQEFKPDARRVSLLKPLHFTHLQWLGLLRWGGYIGVCILCLVVQDTIMSRISILGATTDLAVAAMLLITVIEGSEIGSGFILTASAIYFFSGSAPGPYVVAMLTFLGIGASLLRQIVWHRSRGSIILCAGAAALLYEIALYVAGLFLGLTLWYRFPRFLFTGLLTVAAMIPLYELIYRIGQIGGNSWKE